VVELFAEDVEDRGADGACRGVAVDERDTGG
jgi:hypothetical protein